MLIMTCEMYFENGRFYPYMHVTYDKVHWGPLLPETEGLHPNNCDRRVPNDNLGSGEQSTF